MHDETRPQAEVAPLIKSFTGLQNLMPTIETTSMNVAADQPSGSATAENSGQSSSGAPADAD